MMKSRRELLFLYDIRKGNPNGDPDENRPRVFPDGTYYVTDVRLKRFVRDYVKQKGHDILVDRVGGQATHLTGRVADYLDGKGVTRPSGEELVKAILGAFVDARWFGSSLAFKKEGGKKGWDPKPSPKTLTGPVQFNHGEILHPASEIEIFGTSVFASDEGKTQGTFTSYYGLQYGLVGFHGIANEHSARFTGMTADDYELLLDGLWKGVRSAGNTRTKLDQLPRLLLSLEYKEGSDFQLGDLLSRISLSASEQKNPANWTSIQDYQLHLEKLFQDLERVKSKLERIRLQICPDLKLSSSFPDSLQDLIVRMDLDQLGG